MDTLIINTKKRKIKQLNNGTPMVNGRTTFDERQRLERLNTASIRNHQLEKLNQLLSAILPKNEFYQNKLGSRLQLKTFEDLSKLPFTHKDELVDSSCPAGLAKNLTYSVDHYSRFHRTSGTRGRPVVILDTLEDWQWWLEAWQYILDSANLRQSDRVVMAFSFGPFVGFWSAFDAALERRCLTIPTGSMSTVARIELIHSLTATVVCCTPSYAIHLAEVAKNHGMPLDKSSVSRLIVAGEPGGSVPAIRNRIETDWKATVIDHCGASEVGPWGYANQQGTGIHVNEAEFIPEFLPIGGEESSIVRSKFEYLESSYFELILTCLGRVGSPIIRYRTGDLVQPMWLEGADDKQFAFLKGGVLGRADDMMIIRGINVFPTSIEAILRTFPEVSEFRMTAYREGALDQLKIEVEDELEDPVRIETKLQVELGFRIRVECVAKNSLPRFEAKGKRFIDNRSAGRIDKQDTN